MKSNNDLDHEDIPFIGSQTCSSTCYLLFNNSNIRLNYSSVFKNNKKSISKKKIFSFKLNVFCCFCLLS